MPALYTHAKLSVKQGKWALVIQDCNALIHQDTLFIPAALLRAQANSPLANYAASLKELDHIVTIRPREQLLAMALEQRVWFRATCPVASLRDGRHAVKDATIACKLRSLNLADMIDTLACACVESGDFDSAVRYLEQSMRAPDAGRDHQHFASSPDV